MKFEAVNSGITGPDGFRTAGIACGIKASGLDLAIVTSDDITNAAGIFTTNCVTAAPVLMVWANTSWSGRSWSTPRSCSYCSAELIHGGIQEPQIPYLALRALRVLDRAVCTHGFPEYPFRKSRKYNNKFYPYATLY